MTILLVSKLIEPLFDFDYIKTLVFLFLIKLPSVSEINLTHNVKASLRLLKNSTFKRWIQISISKNLLKPTNSNLL